MTKACSYTCHKSTDVLEFFEADASIMIKVKFHKQIAHGDQLRADSLEQAWGPQRRHLDGGKPNPGGACGGINGCGKHKGVVVAQGLVFIGIGARNHSVMWLRAAAGGPISGHVVLGGVIEDGADAIGMQALYSGLDGIAILTWCWLLLVILCI